MFYNQQSIEEVVLKEINKIPKNFEYNTNNRINIDACIAIVTDIADRVVTSNNVKQLKIILNAKKQRNKTVAQYNECLENNIIFELYKYDNLIDIFNIVNITNLKQMDFQTFYTLMLEDSPKKVISAKHLAQSNQSVHNLLINYTRQNTESHEYDYIFSSLKTEIIAYVMQSVLYGNLEIGNRQIETLNYFKQFSAMDNKAAFDFVITNLVAKKLSLFY